MESLTSFMNLITPYAEKAAAAIVDLAEKHGPEAIELTLFYIRVEILSDMAFCLLWVIVGLIAFIYAVKWRRWAVLKIKETASRYDEEGYQFARALSWILTGFATLCLVISIGNMLSPWNIVGLIKPEVYVIHKAFEAAASKKK